MNKLFVMSLSALFTHVLCGNTLIWSGGSSGELSAASNWGGTTPQAGDVLTFGKAVTVTGSFDLDATGVTFDCSGGDVTSEVAFTGTGALIKGGEKKLILSAAPGHQGGIQVADGQLTVLAAAKTYVGEITIDRTTATSTAKVYYSGDATAMTFANPLTVTGSYGGGSAPIVSSGKNTLTGAISAEGDLKIQQDSQTLTLNGTVTVPEGNTVTLYGNGGNRHIICNASISGNLTKKSGGWCTVTLNAPCGRSNETLTVADGGIVLGVNGSWGGRTVIVKKDGTFNPEFTLNAASNLRSDVTIHLWDIYQLTVNADVYIRELYRNGELQPTKAYAKGELGEYPSVEGKSYHGGNGVLVVGSAEYVWTGASGSNVADASNWSCGLVPVSGAILKFNAAATISGALDLGEKGMTFDCAAAVASTVTLMGAGGLEKTGNGVLTLSGASEHKGGVSVSEGGILLTADAAAGTGMVIVDRSDVATTYVAFGGGVTFTNEISVLGAHGGETSASMRISGGGNVFQGTIVSEGDLWIQSSGSGTTTFNGKISVPAGNTVISDGNGGNANVAIYGGIEGSLRRISSNSSWNQLEIRSSCGGTEDTLEVASGTVIFSNGGWSGTNIVLKLQPKGGFAPQLSCWNGAAVRGDAVLNLTDDFSLYLTTDIAVKEIWRNGIKQAAGTYSAGAFDGKLTGTGTLAAGVVHYSWNGGAYGLWTDPENWLPKSVPGADASVFFGKSVVIGAGDRATDIGSSAFTVDCPSGVNVVLSNVLVGAACLYKTGAGTVTICTNNAYAGGTVILDGTFELWKEAGAGSGDVEVRRSSGKKPVFAVMREIVVPNDIKITGPDRPSWEAGTLCTANAAKFGGKISATESFTVDNSWSDRRNPVVYQGGIEAPGKTITVGPVGWSSIDTSSAFACDVNASIRKDISACPLYFQSGTIGARSEKLTITGGTNAVLAAAHVAYTNIVLSKSTSASCTCCAMRVEGSGCIDPETELRLSNGAMLVLPDGVRVNVARLFVDDVEQPLGAYRASSHPELIGGTGRLRVGPKLGIALIVR